MISFVYEKNQKWKLILSAVFLSIYTIGIVLSGGSAIELLFFWLASVFVIGGSGYAVFKTLEIDKQISNFEIPLIFTLGSGVFVVFYCIGLRINLLLFYIPCILISAFGSTLFYKKNKEYILSLVKVFSKEKTRDLQIPITKEQKTQINFLFFIISALIFVYTFCGVAKFAHPEQVGQLLLSQDFLWNVGNAESFKLGFPPEDIRFFDVRLQYHYFTELLVSGFSTLTGISSYNLLAFYSQSLFLSVLIIALYQFGLYFYNSKTKANFFTIGIFTLSCLSLHKILPNGYSSFSNSLISATLTNINSMSNAFCFTAVFTLMFFNAERKNFRVSVWYYLTMLGSFTLLTFTKSPIAAILAIAIACSLLTRFIQLKFIIREVLFALIFVSFFAIIYFLNFSSGANASTGFSLDYTLKIGYFKNILYRLEIEQAGIYKYTLPIFMFVQSICIAPFTLPVFIISVFKKILNFRNLTFTELYCYAIGIGGFMAFFLFYHEAFSQVYFLYIALFFVTLIAIKEFAFEKIKLKSAPFYLLLIASITTSVFLYINLVGSGLRQYLFHYNILEKYPYPVTVKSEDELAGEFLREIKTQDDMFATNRTHTGYKEGLSNVYSAFSGMQGYMEGFKYAISNMGVSWDIVEGRIAVNNLLFSSGTDPQQIRELCAANGITYLVFSSQFEGSIAHLAGFQVVFQDGTVTIFKIE